MTYRNFGPEMLNAGRTRRPMLPLHQTMHPQKHDQSMQAYLPSSTPKAGAISDLTRELEAIANELGRLKSAQAPISRPAPYAAPHAATQPAFGADQLNALVQSLKNDVRSQMRDDLDAQYMRLRDELDGLAAAISGTSLQNSFKGEIAELVSGLETLAIGNRSIQNSQDKLSGYLQRELGELQSSLHGLARNETLTKLDDRWNSLENRWNTLEHRIEHGLNTDSSAHFSEISARIAVLHDKMNDGGLESLESRMLALAKSVDALAHSRNAGSSIDFSQIDKRFDELSRAVAAIGTERPAPIIDTEALDQIENAIGLLSRKIELVGTMTGQNPSLDAIELKLSQLHDRFSVLPDFFNQEPVLERIDRLAEKVSSIPSPSLSPASIDALTLQLNSLASEIRGNVGGVPIAAGLFDRLDDRLGSIEDRIQNLAFGDTPSDSAAVISALEQRFSELTAHLEAQQPMSSPVVANSADLEVLERKLAEISRQMLQTSEPVADLASFERLENQISDLTAMLTRQPSGSDDTMTARFEALEEMLSKNQHEVLESARKAAEEAASRLQMSNTDVDSAHIVGVIAGELATLEQLTRNSNERSTSAFEGIYGALTKIADRLGALETRPIVSALEPAGSQTPARQKQETPVAAPRLPVAMFPDDAFISPNIATSIGNAPSFDVAEDDLGNFDVQAEPNARKARSPFEMAQEAASAALGNTDDQSSNGTNQTIRLDPADDVPLNPGATIPDLNSILKRVRDQKKATQSQVAKDVDRKDHFLSIKRAAQAAAAEVQQVETTAKGSGALGNVKALYGKFRRPILMIAAAAIVAIGALQLTSAMLSSDPDQISEAPVQRQEQLGQDTQSQNGFEAQVLQSGSVESTAAEAALGDVSNIAPQAAAPIGPEQASPRIVGVESPQGPVKESSGALPASTDANAALSGSATATGEGVVTGNEPSIPLDFGPKPLVDAAKTKNAKAQFEIGRRLAERQNETAALTTAFQWFNAAAGQGFAPAQYRVGNMYEKGVGVERSASDAKLWYQMAAEAGNASAMHNLAVLFASGADGTVDSVSALRWFQKAADLGVGDSQFNLGVMMGKGQGVPQDLEESYKWLGLLAKSGDSEAAAKRDEVGKTMRPEQLESAKAKMQLWKPQPAIAEANDVSVPDEWKAAGGTTASVDVKKAVKNVQLILAKLGYNVGTPDGVMGENTRKAIRAFQKKQNLTVNGEIDAPLVEALLAKNG